MLLRKIQNYKFWANLFFVSFFITVVILQSYISFTRSISIRVEFGTQALFYLLTIIMMAVASYVLLQTIKTIFGVENASFKKEIKEVKNALTVFAVCYLIRVIRNTLYVIYWKPCYTVHRDLLTNFVNIIFYLISDWFAIYAMLMVHHKNFGIQLEREEISNQQLSTSDDPDLGTITNEVMSKLDYGTGTESSINVEEDQRN